MPPIAPKRQLTARLVMAQDVLAAVGLVAGISLSAVSLWVLARKYWGTTAPTASRVE